MFLLSHACVVLLSHTQRMSRPPSECSDEPGCRRTYWLTPVGGYTFDGYTVTRVRGSTVTRDIWMSIYPWRELADEPGWGEHTVYPQ